MHGTRGRERRIERIERGEKEGEKKKIGCYRQENEGRLHEETVNAGSHEKSRIRMKE